MKCFLRYEADSLEDAEECKSITEAKREYRLTAKELYSYGQSISATIHVAKTIEEVAEYPDYVLSFDGAVVCERT